MAKKSKHDSAPGPITEPLSKLLRLPAGPVEMAALDPPRHQDSRETSAMLPQ